LKNNALKKVPAIVNGDSGIVNTDSGKIGKVFTKNRNGCSR